MDVIATIPGILAFFIDEFKQFQALKLFRNVDAGRILVPLNWVFKIILRNQTRDT